MLFDHDHEPVAFIGFHLSAVTAHNVVADRIELVGGEDGLFFIPFFL